MDRKLLFAGIHMIAGTVVLEAVLGHGFPHVDHLLPRQPVYFETATQVGSLSYTPSFSPAYRSWADLIGGLTRTSS